MRPIRTMNLLPKQLRLKELIAGNDHSWIGYGGARGGAKSYAVRSLALYYGFHTKWKLKSLIFRRYSKELLKNHIQPMLEEFPELRKYFNKTEMILYDEHKNPVIQFGYADSEEDIYTFQGTEYDIIFIDEATQCSPHQMQFLRTSNRNTKSHFKPKMVLTMNPGGISHSYIKRLFIDKQYIDNETPEDYVFIHSHVWDNIHWSIHSLLAKGYTKSDYYSWSEEKRKQFCIDNSDYAANLSSLPEEMKIAYLFGDWDIFGGMFFKGFDKANQLVDAFPIPQSWRIIGSIDPGFSSPCSFGLTAIDPEGNYYRIATYYESERSAYEHAEAIHDFLYAEGSIVKKLIGNRKPEMIIAGRDAFAKKDRYAFIANEKTFADIFLEFGFYLTPAVTDRKQGWWAWKSLFPKRYYIFKELNRPLVDEMMSVVSDPKEPEDIQGKGNDPAVSDHALDEQRYAIMSLYKPATPKQKMPVREGGWSEETTAETILNF